MIDRQTLIDHIIFMSTLEISHSKRRLAQLDQDWPELNLINGIKQKYIDEILAMKAIDKDAARARMLQLHADWPELDLLNGIKQALESK